MRQYRNKYKIAYIWVQLLNFDNEKSPINELS
jgi:hypothetical protein